MPSQTKLGKAFEYACARVIYDRYSAEQSVHMVNSTSLSVASNFYKGLGVEKQNDLCLAARAAIKIIERLEPQLQNPNGNEPLYIHLQTDARGIAGDVRDLLCVRKQNNWEIGLSCKHNHNAVKHSRLSQSIDFGASWFNIPCSKEYFQEIEPIFTKLAELRKQGEARNNPVLWRDVPNKEETVYIPILNAFLRELKRLDKKYPSEVPARLVKYLLGGYDFYKVITDDSHRCTRVEVVSFNGTINRASGQKESLVKIPVLKLPSHLYHMGIIHDSNNTIGIFCDEGWQFSMRIHNASSQIEPSLKFDVRLISSPSNGYAQVEPWDE